MGVVKDIATLWPIALVGGVVSAVALALLRCAVAEAAVRVAVRLYSGDRMVRAEKREEWLRVIEDLTPSERPAHAGSLLWLGAKSLPHRIVPWWRESGSVAGWRVMNVTVSSLALVVAAPLLVLTALAIRLDSYGPAVFWTTRIGRGGRKFRMFKFRTLAVDAALLKGDLVDPNAHRELVNVADIRITRVGRLLRRSAIDELPALWNVLRGDMSLVGPRPKSTTR